MKKMKWPINNKKIFKSIKNSFGGVKLLTSGQGGMIITNNKVLYEKIYAIVNRGRTIDWEINGYNIIGDNYQLSEISAYILQPQLDILEELLEKREVIMKKLDYQISKINGFKILKQPKEVKYRAQMAYAFICDFSKLKAQNINKIRKLANEKKLKITSGYKVINQDELLFKNFAKNKKYKNADFIQNNILQIRHYDLFQTKKYYEKLFSFLKNLSK